MRKTELERFRKMLTEERDRVASSLSKHTESIKGVGEDGSSGAGKAHSNHMADQGTDEFQYETAIKFASTEGRYLYHIEEALARVEAGSYGKCEGCGKNINLERLKALPYARLCIECKEKEEAGAL